MASRGGGGIGAGCAAVGLLGLLLGVGITFWLASMAFDGGGGTLGGRADGDRRVRDGLGATTTTPATDDSAVTVRVDPAGELGDRSPVHVTADGLPPNGVATITTCAVAVLPGSGEAGCTPTSVGRASSDVRGHLEVDVVPARVVTSSGLPIDCASAPGTCVVRVTAVEDASRSGSATVAYRTDLPPPEITLDNGF